jgi:hypothetical protein
MRVLLCVFFNLLFNFFFFCFVLFSIFSLLDIMNIVSYIFFSLSRIHHLESGLAASPPLLQKHALNERRFEEVKNGHRLQNWTPI